VLREQGPVVAEKQQPSRQRDGVGAALEDAAILVTWIGLPPAAGTRKMAVW